MWRVIDAAMIAGVREKAAQVVVTVVDQNNMPVANLFVNGTWSMLLKGKASSFTGADGKVTFVSGETKKSGIIRFTVTNVSGDGYVYTPGISYILISSDDPVKSGITAVAIVSIEADDDASPVVNATVSGEWSGLNSGTVSGVTGVDGMVTFTSGKSKKSGDFIFTVLNFYHSFFADS